MGERFDFATNQWVEDDPTLVRVKRELPVQVSEPLPGVWNRPPVQASPKARIAMAGMAGSAIAFLSFAVFQPGIGLVISMWFGIAFFFGYVFTTQEKAGPADLALFEDPGDAEVFLVSINTSAWTIPWPTNIDRGVAWIDGSKLSFSGRRTSFVIGGEDVLPRPDWAMDYEMSRGPGLIVPLRVPNDPRRAIVVTGLPGRSPEERVRYAAFYDTLREFRNHPGQSDGLGRQWPPSGR